VSPVESLGGALLRFGIVLAGTSQPTRSEGSFHQPVPVVASAATPLRPDSPAYRSVNISIGAFVQDGIGDDINQLRIDSADDGSNSLASSFGVLPARTSSTICLLNSG